MKVRQKFKFNQLSVSLKSLTLTLNLLLDNVKAKVINLLKQKDKGVRGALISFQDDNDVVTLRNRIIHKVMTPNDDPNAGHGHPSSSSVNTAGFQPNP